ncbi:nuclear transport factor 2 family protein [Sphingomonas sp. OK281]|uniref:nuclear transport factor 2 family protein n=1 Tax=Sphingomonas sp. OK281 TaxID=1881067 RepID=UPI0008F0ABBE|nr:nuclear transport factor 2 family protein [Sphingomonas sp. OK281]SFO48152.1 hypothetical protein SAMN05428984_4514 [Sphingomonas sp. OK281]
MGSYAENDALGRRLHGALVAGDWSAIRAILAYDAQWTLPGDNRISGVVKGADAIVQRIQDIAAYGVRFDLTDILLSRTDMALAVHNTAERDGVMLDERLATICRVQGDKITSIETFLSDVDNMNAFFI